MSQTSSGFTSSHHPQKDTVGRVGKDYVITELERRTLEECNRESFRYRCVPFALTSIALTQFLIFKGALTTSTRFGSLPKLAFAGVCGYIAGNISYVKTCVEKFKKLENSPLGDALRQRAQPLSPHSGLGRSGVLSEDKAALQSDSQEEALYSYSRPTHSALQSHLPAPGLADQGKEEHDWGTVPQGRSRVKKNIYGDTWEE
ncbi:OCIA domain-containing protein 1 isoform X2 [Brachyhypopomus gauderio]|uniref:OCIA domain-containing protein 1 isoform X2 n=1 Tax=Brachyhypopomus gauderio TaxID=698409 RepID=UPI0040411FE0